MHLSRRTTGHAGRAFFALFAVAWCLALAACSGSAGGGDAGVDATGEAYTALAVDPASLRLAVGSNAVLRGVWLDPANGMHPASAVDGLAWSSADTAVARVDSTGTVTGVSAGTTAVTVRGRGLTGTASVEVFATAPTLSVLPGSAALDVGQSVQLSAVAREADGSSHVVSSGVAWSVTGAAVRVDTSGLVTAVAPGEGSVVAALGEVRASPVAIAVRARTLSVVRVAPADVLLHAGDTMPTALRATAFYADGGREDVSEQATWTSSAPAVASVSNAPGTRGQVTAGATTGSAAVSATFGGMSAAPVNVQVLASERVTSLALSPPTVTVAAGLSLGLTVTATYADGTTRPLAASAVQWTSSMASIATVDAAGMVRGVAPGSAQIRATLAGASGVAPATAMIEVQSATLVSIALDPRPAVVPVGIALRMRIVGTYTDGSTGDVSVGSTWSVEDATIAAVSPDGTLTGRIPGTTRVAASVGALSARADVVVVPAVLRSITLSPANPAVPVGLSQELTATGVRSDGTTTDVTSAATWSSEMPLVAQVSTSGRVTCVTFGGPITITATVGGIMGATNVSCSSPPLGGIEVTPNPAPQVSTGRTRQFQATGYFTLGPPRDLTNAPELTFQSSNPAVAVISNATGSRGLATGLSAGRTEITASLMLALGVTITSAPVPLVVFNPDPVGLELSATSASVAVGATTSLRATLRYSDGSAVDVSDDPATSWDSADTAVATVTNSGTTRGVVTGVAAGSTQVRARVGTFSAMATVTVTGP